jgi:lipopolysaccharide export system permease protein
MKKLDWYILRKFLGTFVYSIAILLVIIIIFDISEKIEDFIKTKPSFRQIAFDYYLNFIPYFVNLFSDLFTFIAVISFTSRLAERTEIVAMLSSGISFNRLLRPYMIGAAIIAGGSLFLNNFVIPHANQKRFDFEEKYIRDAFSYNTRNIHRMIEPGTFVSMVGFNSKGKTGYVFTMDKFKDNKLYYHMNADNIVWDSIKNLWKINTYNIRQIKDLKETMRFGQELDTLIPLNVKDFTLRSNNIETMNFSELNKYIQEQKLQGADNVAEIEIEKQSRLAFPFATFVLTLIGVSLASRKVRGGIGMHILFGLLISFSFILFMRVSSVFAEKDVAPAYVVVWIPNIVFAGLALYLMRKAPK